jgi:methionyl-tRNA formyltransferase
MSEAPTVTDLPTSGIRHPASAISLAIMGSATFAVPTLQKLFEAGYKISGVITQPDKPRGRGQALQAPPLKKTAFELRLPVYQPNSLKNDEAQTLIKALQAEMMIVVAYGKILPPWLLQLPKYGCVNLHGSILPKYRGAAPVHWAVANGETVTGVCAMQMDEGLDTGPVFACRETPIEPDESVQQVYDRLAEIGGELILETIPRIVEGTIRSEPQDHSRATLAPILKKEHGFIDWAKPAAQIHNRVRAFNPWPGTVTKFRGATCKILATKLAGHHAAAPGTIIAGKRWLGVVCGDSAVLEILTIQPENRKPVSGADFANGARIQADEKFQPMMDN